MSIDVLKTPEGPVFIHNFRPQGYNGPRVRIPCPDWIKTKEEADKYDRKMRAELLALRKGGRKEKAPEAATVADLWPAYIIWYELYQAESTLKDVKSVWKNHLKTAFGPMPVMALTDIFFTNYQRSRQESSVTNRTINKEIDYFKGFMTWCRNEKKIPVPAVSIKPLPHTRPLPIVMSVDEVWRVIEAAEPFWRAFFGVMYTAALRKGEAQKLTWADIDGANMQIRSLQKGGTYKILPASPWLMEAIEAIRPEGWRPSDYVFRSNATGTYIQNSRGAIDRAIKKAGVQKHVHNHLFRHSLAVHAMADGTNQQMIQRFLGQRDARSTAFYTTVSMEHLRAMSDKFGGLSRDKHVKVKPVRNVLSKKKSASTRNHNKDIGTLTP